jgi:hypothetical protein
MVVITYRNGVSIGELVVYFPALAVAILLNVRHGFGRSSGWVFLIIFTLARIIGSCFQLAEINDPTNKTNYIAAAILNTVGLSPLELAGLGLLSRVISSINKRQDTLIKPYHMKLVQALVTIGLILGIVGGVNASNDFGKSNAPVQTLSKAALALFIVAYGFIVLTTILSSFSVSCAEAGEKRLLLAVALSIPFLLVRLIYSAIALFGNNSDFNSSTGNITIFLCMALLMELAAVTIYEAMGITLHRAVTLPEPTIASERIEQMEYAPRQDGPSTTQQIASTLGRKTIIGRLITGHRRERRR